MTVVTYYDGSRSVYVGLMIASETRIPGKVYTVLHTNLAPKLLSVLHAESHLFLDGVDAKSGGVSKRRSPPCRGNRNTAPGRNGAVDARNATFALFDSVRHPCTPYQHLETRLPA